MAPRSSTAGTTRLDGVDLARAIAILGMFVAHTFSHHYPENSWLNLADGRASILFAILAGISVEFLTSKRGRATERSLIIRGSLLAALGLSLSLLPVGPMVILTTYGALYCFVAPVVYRWNSKTLAIAAATLAISWPILVKLMHPLLLPTPLRGITPTWHMLLTFQWRTFAEALFITGLFPVIAWTPYLLFGIVIGRMLKQGQRALQRLTIALGILAGFAGLAVSQLIVYPLGFAQRYSQFHPDGQVATDFLLHNASGRPVPDHWEWLLIYVPHSGSIVETLSSGGFAAAIIILSVWICAALPITSTVHRVLQPLLYLGRMPLTVYSAHVCAIGLATMLGGTLTAPFAAWLNLLLPIAFATWWFRNHKRGPLEALLTTAASR